MRRSSTLFLALALATPLSAHASLSCTSTCTTGVLSQSGNYYDIFVDCSDGSYSAATGASHPATVASGSAQNVIYGGDTGSPGTSTLGLYLYSTSEHFSSGAELGATTVTPLGSCTFDPPDTVHEPSSLGIESEWLITDSSGNQYVWRHEVVTFGDSVTNAGARLTQSVTTPAAPATTALGLRWQIDYESADDDGPVFAVVTCDPFATSSNISTEQDISPTQLGDFYRMVNNDGSTPLVDNYTSTTNLGGFPDTVTPDRVVYGNWGFLVDADWAYVSFPISADSDSAVLYYIGATQGNAILASANSTVSRSLVLFNGVDADDCGDFEPKDTGEPPDTQEPEDTADTQDPVDPTSYYAGGCANCSTGGASAPTGLALLALALPLYRRRRIGGGAA